MNLRTHATMNYRPGELDYDNGRDRMPTTIIGSSYQSLGAAFLERHDQFGAPHRVHTAAQIVQIFRKPTTALELLKNLKLPMDKHLGAL